MIQTIDTIKDVKAFIEQVAHEIDNFHLLTDFKDYVYPDSYMRRYTDEEAETRNKQLDRCIEVCERHTEDCFSYLMWYYELMRVQMIPVPV